MHKEAFNGLGFVYKLRKGYYSGVVKILVGVAKKKAGANAINAVILGVGVGVLAAVARKIKFSKALKM